MIIMAVLIYTKNEELFKFKVLDFMNYRTCHGSCTLWWEMDQTVLWVRWSFTIEAWVQSQCIWELWLTKWHWDRFFSHCFGFPPSLSFHQCCILIFMCGWNYRISVTDNIDTQDSLVSIVNQFRVWTLVRVKYYLPIQTVSEASLAYRTSCTFGTRSFSQV